MIDFSKLKGLVIPEGAVSKIEVDGKVLWEAFKYNYNYVTLGDSVGEGAGVEDKAYNFTSLLGKELENIYGSGNVLTQNKAIGGHTIPDLMARLDEDEVKNVVKNANLITISIGGNDVLYTAFESLEQYIMLGDEALDEMTNEYMDVLNNQLANDAYPTSYNNLFKKISELNPNAKVCFTTQYNPYKYLWMEEGEDGFFKTLFDTFDWIEDKTIANVLKEFVKYSFFGEILVKNFFKRVNGLNSWIEKLINSLNTTLKNKINDYNNKNNSHNFFVAETKALFDSIRDRDMEGLGDVRYNDLVHVKYTRGFYVGDISWGQLWSGKPIKDMNGNVLLEECNSADSFWNTLYNEYLNGNSNITGFITTLLYMVVERVIKIDLDVHPKEHGYYFMMRSFADTLRNNISNLSALPALKTVTYNSNGGTGSMETQKVLDISYNKGVPKNVYSILNVNTFTPSQEGYRFIGWNIDSSNSVSLYGNAEAVHITANTTLYAQWSNQYIIKYRHTRHTTWYTDDETGHKECYALYINGIEMPDFDKFSSERKVDAYSVPYGTKVKVVVSNYNPTEIIYDDVICRVYLNGEQQREGYKETSWEFNLDSDVDIDFRWKTSGTLATADARSWEDCHITTFDASREKLTQPYKISFNANGANGSMATQKILKLGDIDAHTVLALPTFTPSQEGYRFVNWKDQYGNTYSNEQRILVNSDLVLTAQWSNMYVLNIYHSMDSDFHTNEDTGPQENYAVWINDTKVVGGNDGLGLGSFNNKAIQIVVPYNSNVGVIAQVKKGDARSYITLNGSDNKVASDSNDARWGFVVTSDMDIHFEWNYFFSDDNILQLEQSYWNCYLTTFDASYMQLSKFYKISYNAGTYGQGSTTTYELLRLGDNNVYTSLMPNTFTPSQEGYYFVNWKDQYGNTYSKGQRILVNSDIVLTAQWDNRYTLTYKHTNASSYHSSSDTGIQECYGLYINGGSEADLGSFSNGPREYFLPYGTQIKVEVAVNSGSARSYIKFNGTKDPAGDHNSVSKTFTLTTDTTVNMEYDYYYAASIPPLQEYWVCDITTK